MGNDHYEVIQRLWAPIARDIFNGSAGPSFARDIMCQSDTKYATDHDEAMYLTTSVAAAGSDNIRRAQNVFMMAAICHPEVVTKARSMIDVVCGPDTTRLPAIADLDSLPYISAVIKECLRWRPVAPLVPQHRSTKPIQFDGFVFPTGTDFVVNSLAVCAEEDDEFDQFKPESWTGRELNIIDGLWQFGGGRRICPGYKVAHQELFFAIATLIYCFDIAPDGPVNSRLLRHDAAGEPFPVRITVRSQAHANLIVTLHDHLANS